MDIISPEHENFKKIVKKVLVTWENINDESILIEKLTYGHSREVYKVTSLEKSITPSSVILRKFKEKMDEKENYVFQEMAKAGLGPAFYGIHENIRIEEYLVSRVLKSAEINETLIRRKLAIQLGGIHQLKLDKIEKSKSFFEKRLLDENFMGAFRKQLENPGYRPEEKKIVDEIKELASQGEIDFAIKTIQQYSLGISHNDVWVGNILIQDKTDNVFYIDYEMFDYNFEGYDIGKTLLETVFIRPKEGSPYHEIKMDNYPKEEEFIDFIKYYLVSKELDSISMEEKTKIACDESIFKHYENLIFADSEQYQLKVKSLLKETKVGILISTYYCTALGIILGREFPSDMDFVQFAIDNFYYYKLMKNQLSIEI